MAISLDTYAEPQTVDLTTDDTKYPSLDTATSRANRVQIGLNEFISQKDYDQTLQSIMQGQENNIRNEAATNIDLQKSQQAQANLINTITKQPIPQSPEQLNALVNSLKPKKTDPNSVIEENYAKRYLNQIDSTVADNEISSWIDTAKTYSPIIDVFKSIGQELISKREFLYTKYQDAKDTAEHQTWGGYLADRAKGLLPGYTDVKLRGNVPGVSVLSGGLLGENLDRQATAAMKLPFDQFKDVVTRTVDRLKEDNPELAVKFMDYMLGQSSREQTLDDFFNLVDLSIVGGVAKGSAKLFGSKAATAIEVRNSIKAVTAEANKAPEASKTAIANAVGDIGEAAVQRTTDQVVSGLKGTLNPIKEALDALPSVLRADAAEVALNPGNYGREATNKLVESFNMFSSKLMNVIETAVKVSRTPLALTTENVIRAVKDNILETYPGIRNAILDMSVPTHNPISNTLDVFINIGNNGKSLFFSKSNADNFAKAHGIVSYELDRKGLGWFIKTRKSLDETQSVIKDAYLTTKMPDPSYAKKFISWIRSAEDVQSKEARMNRQVAVYATSNFTRIAKEEAKSIQALKWSLNRDRWHEWKRVVDEARQHPDPVTKEKGAFFRSPGELEEFYQNTIQRLPDAKEVDAYFSFKKINEMDRVLRNIAVYKNKARLGAESHQIFTAVQQLKRMYSDSFDGMVKKELPGGEDAILVIGHKIGEEKVVMSNNPALHKEFEDLVKNGEYKAIEIYDPDLHPFKTFGGPYGNDIGNKRIRYVLARNVESKPLSWDQVPRKGGGHFDYNYDFYIKQAQINPDRIGNIFRHIYTGDTTVMPVSNRAMGHDLAKKLDTVRDLLNQGKRDEARVFTERYLPSDWKTTEGWFKPRTIDGVKHPPRLSLTERIQVVEKGKLIGDTSNELKETYKGTYKDGTRQGSAARQYQVEYTGERDSESLSSVLDKGTKGNPIYELEPAQLVDPITSMHRAMTKIINSSFLNDYKIFAVEEWLRKAEPFLKVQDDIGAVRYSPFHYYNNPDWLPNMPLETKSNLLASKFQINQLVGVRNITDTFIHSATQKLADSIWKNLGPGKTLIATTWALPKLTDPFKFIRSVVVNEKLGLFNVPQLLVQSMTYSNIAGIAGVSYALPAMRAALLSRWARHASPEMLNTLDKYASSNLRIPGTSKWKVGEWKESHNEMQRSGFGNIGGEYSLKDDMSSSLVQSAGSKVLDLGQMFFKLGESFGRDGAWHTAFKEFRDINPTKVLTDLDRKEILLRADLLNSNMSRASHSTLNSGVFSIPAQFLTWQLRQTELFFGKGRLTPLERARLLATNATLYGIPVATGITGFPFADLLRKNAIESGYVVGDNWIDSLIQEGLPSLLGALITGKGDSQAGNWYNFGDRYGSKGFDLISSMLRPDKTMMDIFGGAAYSSIAGTIEGTDGFRKAMGAMIRGAWGDNTSQFKMKGEDLIDAFKEIAIVHAGWRAYMAVHYGRWLSKKEGDMGPVSVSNAIFQSLTGVQDQNISDISLMSWSMKIEEDLQKHVLNRFIQEYRRYLVALKDNDPEQAKDYAIRAISRLTMGGYPEQKIPSAIALAAQEHQSLVERINWNFDEKNAPDASRSVRDDAFRRRQIINYKREQK